MQRNCAGKHTCTSQYVYGQYGTCRYIYIIPLLQYLDPGSECGLHLQIASDQLLALASLGRCAHIKPAHLRTAATDPCLVQLEPGRQKRASCYVTSKQFASTRERERVIRRRTAAASVTETKN